MGEKWTEARVKELRDRVRLEICEGDFDFTKIFESITFEDGTYIDISNDGADALADYFTHLFIGILESQQEAK